MAKTNDSSCFHCRKPIVPKVRGDRPVRLSQGLVHRECYEAIRDAYNAAYQQAIEDGRHPRPQERRNPWQAK